MTLPPQQHAAWHFGAKLAWLLSLSSFTLNPSSAQPHTIGWQTFKNKSAGNNNSGIEDNAPESNSTFDPTPVGSSAGNLYLTGSIGAQASNNGWGGYGQATNADFLNGPTFGESIAITEISLADGSPGSRIGPYGNPPPNGEANNGTSSWKFSSINNSNQLRGDVSITNHSDYFFELEHLHFDARGLVNPATSPDTLQLRYLATPGELIDSSTNLEVPDLSLLYTHTWAATGTENVSQNLADPIGSAVRIPPGANASFRFVWSGNKGAGHAQIDNLAFSGIFRDQARDFVKIDPTRVPPEGFEGPNIIVIIPDDQRWDATSYMQQNISATGRTARFPWLASPVPRTPNMDRLSTEGTHFSNAFVVYSICSPSRATMLTGQYPHLNGVTDNHTPFPSTATTYATLLRDQGYATGYFGKWHMGTQKERPGFDTAVSFMGQGTYFETEFFDENGTSLFTSTETDWVDDVSTQHAKNFITSQNQAERPFLMVLGFKTPHQPWEPPMRTNGVFSSDTPVAVPNLGVAPPFAPGATGGSDLGELRRYLRTVVGIDQNVGEILTLLDELDIAENTAVIFLSDNGFFRGEHRLGDKRSAYEESLRIPFMIRYPAAQVSPQVVDQIALNLDVAPTILDIAGLPVPEAMQGRSLLPLLEGQSPSDWRDSFLFSYNVDPEFPNAAVAPHLGLRREDGLKIVSYSEDHRWNELYDASDDADPYEIDNLYSSPAHLSDLASIRGDLISAAHEFGFIKVTTSPSGFQQDALTVQAAKGSSFQIEASPNLESWQLAGNFQGGGTPTTLSLVNPTFNSSETVPGDPADHVLAEGPPVKAVQGFDTLRAGSVSSAGGRDAVLIFELPIINPPLQIAMAELEVKVIRTFAQWDADLWTLGIKEDTTPILEYSETPSGNPEVIKLQDALFDFQVSNEGQTVKSNSTSGLTHYLQKFYKTNPDYAGGKYLFLRINPTSDVGVNEQRFTITAAESGDANARPKLNFYYTTPPAGPSQQFYRVRYGNTAEAP